jgi:tetratricopeptide (TPR) repeat protein
LEGDNLTNTMGRLSIWKSALSAIRDKPFFGWGLGNFEAGYYAHQFPVNEILLYGKNSIFAHNSFLQVAAEAGIPALLIALWASWTVFSSIRSYCRTRDGQWAQFSLIVLCCVGFFNYAFLLPFNGLLYAGIAGVAIKEAGSPRNVRTIQLHELKWPVWIIGLVFSFFLMSYSASEMFMRQEKYEMAATVAPYRSDAWYKAGIDALILPESQREAIPFLERAIKENKTDPFYQQRVALVLANQDSTETDRIDQYFSNAQRLAPHHAPFYIQEGFYRLMRHQTEKSIQLFAIASELEPLTPLPYYGLGLATNDRRFLIKAKELKENEATLRSRSAYDAQTLSSDYAQFLFSVDLEEIDKLISPS